MVLVINTTKSDQNIGGHLIYAGQSRMIEDSFIREALAKGMEIPELAPAPAAEPPAPARPTIEEIQKLPIAQISLLFPSLKDEEILQLEELEKKADPPRETLLKQIEKEIAGRSAGK